MAESGFPEEAKSVRAAWLKGDREGATKLVPDAMIQAFGIVGPAVTCRERVQAYRESGIRVPVISPAVSGPDGKASVYVTLPKNSVGSKQIRNGQVKPVDLAASTKRNLKGKRGPQGPQGSQGSQGPQGAQGPRGQAGAPGSDANLPFGFESDMTNLKNRVGTLEGRVARLCGDIPFGGGAVDANGLKVNCGF